MMDRNHPSLALLAAVILAAVLAASPARAAIPEDMAALTKPDDTLPRPKLYDRIMANSQTLADNGYFLEAADLRVRLLDHFPGSIDRPLQEPYTVQALGLLWGIKLGSALPAVDKPAEWHRIIDWYQQAGAYRKLIAAYEKALRDPYRVFRDWEAARHREAIEQFRRELDSALLENLKIPPTFLVDPQLVATFDVANTSLQPRKVGPFRYTVTDAAGAQVVNGTIDAVELAAESRQKMEVKPNVDRAGTFKLTIAADGLSKETPSVESAFSFASKASPKPLAPGRADLIAAADGIPTEGAALVDAPWSDARKAIVFPGKASFPIELSQDGCYYLEIATFTQQPNERTSWKLWVDGNLNTPAGMHGSGPIHFVTFASRPVAGGVVNTTLWRVPLFLAEGVHTLDIALSLDQQLERISLLPAIADKVIVKNVKCAAPFGMFYPDEPIDLTMTLQNLTDVPLSLQGDALYGQYRQRGLGGWVGEDWNQLSQAKTYKVEPFKSVTIAPNGTLDVPINFNPAEMGHVGVTLRLSDGKGIYLAMGADYARVFKPLDGPKRDSFFLCEMRDVRQVDFAGRLGIKWGRWGSGEDYYKAAAKYGITNLMILMGSPREFLPTSRPIGTDSLPAVGAMQKFEDWVYAQVAPHKDQIGAVTWFNEPWEGKTYWGYGARGDHYRLSLKYLFRGVKRASPDIQVLAPVAEWRLLPEPGMDQFFDGVDVHYGGITGVDSDYLQKIGKPVWNAEFWFGEKVDDTQMVVEHLVHLMRGYRTLNWFIPFWGGHTSGTVRPRTRLESHDGNLRYVQLAADLKTAPYEAFDVGSKASVDSAMIHFLMDTDYQEVVRPLTVPWAFAFKGKNSKAGSNVAAMVSHIGVGMIGDQARDKWTIYQSPRKLRSFVPAWNRPELPGQFVLFDPQNKLKAYDILGNPTGQRDGDKLIVPVTPDVVYVVHQGSYDDFTALLKTGATRAHRPYEITLYDITTPLDAKPSLKVKVRNLYPQPTRGKLHIDAPAGFTLAKNDLPTGELAGAAETTLEFPIESAQASAANEYIFTATAETEDGQKAALTETLSVATAVYGKVTVDGDLSEWKQIGAVSQFLTDRKVGADATLAAENPFMDLKKSGQPFFGEFATAWDEDNFYYMARVHDPTYQWQISNFKDTDRYLFFPYPNDYIYRSAGWPGNSSLAIHCKGLYFNIEGIEKPKGYRRYPEDVFDATDWRTRIGPFRNTDYDYVAYSTRFGPELLRTRKDKFYFIHPYPLDVDFMRLNCQVPGNKLSVTFDKTTGDVIYEGAIPWSEMDQIKPEAGKQLKLGWLIARGVRDTLEWNTGRSTSVLNGAGIPFQGRWSISTPWALYKKP